MKRSRVFIAVFVVAAVAIAIVVALLTHKAPEQKVVPATITVDYVQSEETTQASSEETKTKEAEAPTFEITPARITAIKTLFSPGEYSPDAYKSCVEILAKSDIVLADDSPKLAFDAYYDDELTKTTQVQTLGSIVTGEKITPKASGEWVVELSVRRAVSVSDGFSISKVSRNIKQWMLEDTTGDFDATVKISLKKNADGKSALMTLLTPGWYE